MKTHILTLLLLLAVTALGEENPFPVLDDKVLDPTPTADEKEKLTAYSRARKDGKQDSAQNLATLKEGLEKRLVSAPTKWTDDDFKARLKLLTELGSQGVDFGSNTDSVQTAIRTFVSSKDADPDGFVRRVALLSPWKAPGGARIMWRQIVNEFLEHDKYKKATPQQRYEFVHDWLLPKMPKNAVCVHDVEDLARDLKADAGVTDAKPHK